MINLHHKLKWTVCQPAQHCHSGFYFNSDSSISPVFGALSSLLHRALAQFHNFSIVHRCMHFLAHCPTLTKAHQHWPTVFHSPSCKSGWNRKQHPHFYSFFFVFVFLHRVFEGCYQRLAQCLLSLIRCSFVSLHPPAPHSQSHRSTVPHFLNLNNPALVSTEPLMVSTSWQRYRLHE